MSVIYTNLILAATAVIFILTSICTILSVFGFGNPPRYYVHLEDSYKKPLFNAILLESAVLAFLVAYSFFDLKQEIDNKEKVIGESVATIKDFENKVSNNKHKSIVECDSLGSLWHNDTLKESYKIEQTGCSYSGSLETADFNHTISGTFISPTRATMNIERINKSNGCVTNMFGTVYLESAHTIRRTIVATDGNCELPKTFSNSIVYQIETANDMPAP